MNFFSVHTFSRFFQHYLSCADRPGPRLRGAAVSILVPLYGDLLESTAHCYINRPFASASKLAAVLSTSLKYHLADKTKCSQPCLSSISFAMRAHHGGRSDEDGLIVQASFALLASLPRWPSGQGVRLESGSSGVRILPVTGFFRVESYQ